MIRYLFSLFILLLAVWLGLKLKADPGYLLIAYQQWTVEMPLWIAGLVLVLVCLLFSIVVSLITQLGTLKKRFSKWYKYHSLVKLNRKIQKGIMLLVQGQWAKAEKTLSLTSQENPLSFVQHTAAALAAQKQGALIRQAHHLHQAYQTTAHAELPIGLIESELGLKNNELDKSLGKLQNLHQQFPKQPRLLALLSEVYLIKKEWLALLKLLPDIKKTKSMSLKNLLLLEITIYVGLLHTLVDENNEPELVKTWQQIPRRLQVNKKIVAAYVNALLYFAKPDEAISILQHTLKKEWDDGLILRYSQCESADPTKQLAWLEHEMKKHASSAALFYSLAKLAKLNQLWGKARDYFTTAIKLESNSQLYFEYGKLLEQLGESQAAKQAFQKGLEIANKLLKPYQYN